MRARASVLLELPPFLYTPRWAAGPALSTEELGDLQLAVTDLVRQTAELLAVLSVQPGPSWERLCRIDFTRKSLEDVLTILREIRYSSGLTHWIDRARAFARDTAHDLNSCLQSIEHLKGLIPATQEYSDYLERARASCQNAHRFAEEMSTHLHLLWELPEGSERLSSHAQNATEQLTSESSRSEIIDLLAEKSRRRSYDNTQVRMKMSTKGEQYRKLHKAIMSAFPNRETLEQMVYFELDQNLEEIAGGDNLSVIIFRLIIWARQNGRLPELVRKAHKFVPGNPELRTCSEELLPLIEAETLANTPSAAPSDAPHPTSSTSTTTVASARPETGTPLGSARPTVPKHGATAGNSSLTSSNLILSLGEQNKNPSALPKMVAVVHTLRQDIAAELQKLEEIQIILLQSDPSWRRMLQVEWAPVRCRQACEWIQGLHNYPPQLTHAIVTVRQLVKYLSIELDRCYQAVIQLQGLLADEIYREQLAIARDSCPQLVVQYRKLVGHLQKIETDFSSTSSTTNVTGL